MGGVTHSHWNATAKSNAVGSDFEPTMERFIGRAPQAIAEVQAQLPHNFPAHVSDRIFEGVMRQVRSLRQQLNSIRERVRERPLVESITALDQKLQGLEGNEERGTFLSTLQGRSLARLNVGLTTLLAAVDSADLSPTTQQLTTFNNVKNALDQQLANWDQIKRTDIPAMNLQLRQSGLSMLNPESGAVIEQRWHSAEKAVGED